MSKSTEIDQSVKRYILSIIDSEGYEDTKYFTQCKSNPQKIDFLRERFNAEYGYRVDQIGRQPACREWLQGLAINIAYTNHDIVELAIEWGSLPKNPPESQIYRTIDNYFNFMAAKIVQLFNGYHVPREKVAFKLDIKLVDKST